MKRMKGERILIRMEEKKINGTRPGGHPTARRRDGIRDRLERREYDQQQVKEENWWEGKKIRSVAGGLSEYSDLMRAGMGSGYICIYFFCKLYS